MAPQSQIQPELTKTTPSQHDPQNSTFCSATGSDSCYIGNQPLYFHQMTPSDLRFPTSAKGGSEELVRSLVLIVVAGVIFDMEVGQKCILAARNCYKYIVQVTAIHTNSYVKNSRLSLIVIVC